jgi:peptidoglycan DL-endopeptidase CwlO
LKKKLFSAVLILAAAFMSFNSASLAASANVRTTILLKAGSAGTDVKTLQTLLRQNGFPVTVDGKYGANTIAAVKKFQAAAKLKVDGIAGPVTMKVLSNASGNITLASVKTTTRTLRKGMSGADVKSLQNMLIVNDYSIRADGKFGDSTEAALKKYQTASGLKVDGIAGPATIRRMQNVEKFIAIVKSKLGCKYVAATRGPDEFDCTGFVYWCLTQAGVKDALMSNTEGWAAWDRYPRIHGIGNIMRGDILVQPGHVSVYVGGNKNISALGSEWGVCYTDNIRTRFATSLVCATRIF